MTDRPNEGSNDRPDNVPAVEAAPTTTSPAAAAPGGSDPRMLEILVCPLTKTTLSLNRQSNELISRAARLAFPIRHGVPMLTADAARELTDEEIDNLR